MFYLEAKLPLNTCAAVVSNPYYICKIHECVCVCVCVGGGMLTVYRETVFVAPNITGVMFYIIFFGLQNWRTISYINIELQTAQGGTKIHKSPVTTTTFLEKGCWQE